MVRESGASKQGNQSYQAEEYSNKLAPLCFLCGALSPILTPTLRPSAFSRSRETKQGEGKLQRQVASMSSVNASPYPIPTSSLAVAALNRIVTCKQVLDGALRHSLAYRIPSTPPPPNPHTPACNLSKATRKAWKTKQAKNRFPEIGNSNLFFHPSATCGDHVAGMCPYSLTPNANTESQLVDNGLAPRWEKGQY